MFEASAANARPSGERRGDRRRRQYNAARPLRRAAGSALRRLLYREGSRLIDARGIVTRRAETLLQRLGREAIEPGRPSSGRRARTSHQPCRNRHHSHQDMIRTRRIILRQIACSRTTFGLAHLPRLGIRSRATARRRWGLDAPGAAPGTSKKNSGQSRWARNGKALAACHRSLDAAHVERSNAVTSSVLV